MMCPWDARLLLSPFPLETAWETVGIFEWAWQQKGLVDLCGVGGYAEVLSALWHFCWVNFTKIIFIKTTTATTFVFPIRAFRAGVLGTAGWFNDRQRRIRLLLWPYLILGKGAETVSRIDLEAATKKLDTSFMHPFHFPFAVFKLVLPACEMSLPFLILK